MIYIKNTKEKQTIYIPRTELYTEQYVNPVKTYEEGYNDGFGKGVDKGIDEQKSKLETIVINDNGTYEREDGYNKVIVEYQDLNGSYDEGYADGKNDGYNEGKEDGFSDGYNEGYDVGYTDGGDNQKSKLETITITENGTYTKEDGYSNIEVNVPDINGSYDEGYVIGKSEGYAEGKNDGIDEQKSKLESISITENGVYAKEDGYNEIVVEVPDLNGSFEEGYSEGYDKGKDDGYAEGIEEGVNNAGEIIAQTAQVLNVTENGVYSTKYSKDEDSDSMVTPLEGNLIRTVNVNVIPKINVARENIKLSNSTFTKVPEWVDFEGIVDMYYMFYYCNKLTELPLFDTSNVISMSYAFSFCSVNSMPEYNTENVTNMSNALYGCYNLKTIPVFNTSKVTNFNNFIGGCSKFEHFPQLDTSSATNFSSMFSSCSQIISIAPLNASNVTTISTVFGYSQLKNLTDFGGFIGLKCKWNDSNGLKMLPNLTYESCINVLNGLYDFTGNGETPTSNQAQLKVHANFLTTVGDEISIGTDKGWTITS